MISVHQSTRLHLFIISSIWFDNDGEKNRTYVNGEYN